MNQQRLCALRASLKARCVKQQDGHDEITRRTLRRRGIAYLDFVPHSFANSESLNICLLSLCIKDEQKKKL